MKKCMVLFFVIMCSACNGHFKTISLEKDANPPQDGIIFYDLAVYRVTYMFTQYIDAKTKILDPSGCNQAIQKDELVYYPDISKRKALVYSPAYFGSSQLQVSLNNGILTAINTQNAPATAQLLGTLETSFKDLSALYYTKKAEKLVKKACNAAPRIINITKIEDFSKVAQ